MNYADIPLVELDFSKQIDSEIPRFIVNSTTIDTPVIESKRSWLMYEQKYSILFLTGSDWNRQRSRTRYYKRSTSTGVKNIDFVRYHINIPA